MASYTLKRLGALTPRRLPAHCTVACDIGPARALRRGLLTSGETNGREFLFRWVPSGEEYPEPMLALIVSLNVKPDLRDRFLAAAEDDSICSVRDEPGCLRFDVLQDKSDQNHFFF